MTNQTTKTVLGLCAAVALLPAAATYGQLNGLKTNARFFNDFTTSTLNISNNNAFPGSVSIDDRNMVDDGVGGNFANRHDVLVSTDAGATAGVFNTATPFQIEASVQLSVGSTAPRKEAGLRVNSPITGDVLFLVNSDAGEIVAFGGGAPFKIFGSNGGGNGYTPGTSILMGMKYTPGSPKGTLEYYINRGSGIETSGPLNWDNLEGGPVNYSFGMYTQISPANGNDFATAVFRDVTAAIPEPASMGMLALGGAALASRRRK